MKTFKALIGEDEVYYDRRDCLSEDDPMVEVKYINAETYNDAEAELLDYIKENYEDTQYELYEVDEEDWL